MSCNTNVRQAAGEALPRPNTPRCAFAPVTTYREVPPNETGDPCLFAVQAGIPVADALELLDSLLRTVQGNASDIADAIDRGSAPTDCWASVRLLSFARAVAVSVMFGVQEAEAAAEAMSEGGAA